MIRLDQELGMQQGYEMKELVIRDTAASVLVESERCFLLWAMNCIKGKASWDKTAEIGFVLLNAKGQCESSFMKLMQII